MNLGLSIDDEADDGFVFGGESSLVLLHLDDGPRQDLAEVGLLLKLPLRLWGSAPR